MKRKFVSIKDVPSAMGYCTWDEMDRFCADLWENMGFCRDGVTKWYHFTNTSGEACYTLKR